MTPSQRKRIVKICLALGQVVPVDVKKERKTFKVPSISEYNESVSFEVPEEVADKLGWWFYDNAIYTWPTGYYVKNVRKDRLGERES